MDNSFFKDIFEFLKDISPGKEQFKIIAHVVVPHNLNPSF